MARWDAEADLLRARMERDVIRLQRLGPRATVELLCEIGLAGGSLEEVAGRLERYASLPLQMVRAAQAEAHSPRLRLVEATHQAAR